MARREDRIPRRQFLRDATGLLVAGAAAPVVLSGPEARAAALPGSVSAALAALGPTSLRAPGSLPFPDLAPGTDTLPHLEHIVVLMMENHSFNNLFGMLGRGDGFTLDASGAPTATNPYPDGCLQHAFHMPTTCPPPAQPSQEWAASHNAYDNGANDGFVRTPISPATSEIVGGVAMGYWTGEDLPFRYSLASTFAIGDRWFSSLLGQTDPNRRYLIAGTSAGMTDDIGTSPFQGSRTPRFRSPREARRSSTSSISTTSAGPTTSTTTPRARRLSCSRPTTPPPRPRTTSRSRSSSPRPARAPCRRSACSTPITRASHRRTPRTSPSARACWLKW